VEYDDLPDVRFAEMHAEAVDEHSLALDKRRFHRAAWDAVGLDDEGLDRKRQAKRDGDDHDQLYD
jgi:hypothetical protein